MTAAPQWKCGVCSTRAGDLVCSKCVTREAERRRVERAERLEGLRAVREATSVAVKERQDSIQQDARLEKEAALENYYKDHAREVTQRVAEAESQLHREAAATGDLREALLEGLRRHTDIVDRTLRQRRWRKVVQLFVLLPVAPSMPTGSDMTSNEGNIRRMNSRRSAPSGNEEQMGRAGIGEHSARSGTDLRAATAVSGVSTLVDLPLPNNGDYGQVPADVLMAALALLARLVAGVAKCLGVTLPHPLFPAASLRYAAVAVDSSPKERSSLYPLCPLSKLAEIGVMGAGSSIFNTVGAFETALDLLRSDVVHLCVEGARVPVDRLWPAEALLLNLWELQQHAISELRSSSPMVDVPLPMPKDHTEQARKGHVRKNQLGSVRRSSSAPKSERFHRTAGDGFVADAGRDRRTSNRGAAVQSTLNTEGAAVVTEDEEETYEFVADSGADGQAYERAGTGRWPSWGSRLAAAGGTLTG